MTDTPRRRWPLVVAGAAVLSTLAVWVLVGGDDDVAVVPTYTVARGPLVISVIETGTIKPQEQLVITSEVQGQTTILSLVDEGTRVAAGDLLVELDASSLEDQRTEQQIKVQNAEAAFIGARESLAVTRSQAESDVSKAELDHRFAKEDLAQYTEGEYPNQLRQAESEIALAEEEVERASEKRKWSEVLSTERYISTTELQADQLAARRAQLELELARSALELLQEYTHTRRVDELESAITQTGMALDRVTRKAAADVVQAEAAFKAKESEYRRQQDRLAKLERQIEKTRITAPRDGLVVYATSARGGWRGNDDPLQEGQQVRERQELIHLPTDKGMQSEINVHESQLGMVRPGLPARIDIDAIPGTAYTGRVATIAPLPDATQMWMNPDLKVYPTQILLEQNDPALRTGMSCRVEIVVERHEDAIQVPVQAVVRHGRHALAWVRDAAGGFAPRAITVGNDNGSLIHVREGLAAGEEVLLTPPLEPPADLELPEPEPRLEPQPLPAADSVPVAGTPAPEATTTAPSQPVTAPVAEGERPRGNWREMSDEERAKMRERFQNMSEEERAAWRERRRRERSEGEDGGGGERRGGGEGGGAP